MSTIFVIFWILTPLPYGLQDFVFETIADGGLLGSEDFSDGCAQVRKSWTRADVYGTFDLGAIENHWYMFPRVIPSNMGGVIAMVGT